MPVMPKTFIPDLPPAMLNRLFKFPEQREGQGRLANRGELIAEVAVEASNHSGAQLNTPHLVEL
jgi:hypothetical protein